MIVDLDDNECATNETNACEQICVNTPGSYVCQCNSGFRLKPDRQSCEGMISGPERKYHISSMLLFSSSRDT